jgi:hypothetical protein
VALLRMPALLAKSMKFSRICYTACHIDLEGVGNQYECA